jgi:polyisoprenyl-teichoic acid--peptidoglycan teichoic acid transferase
MDRDSNIGTGKSSSGFRKYLVAAMTGVGIGIVVIVALGVGLWMLFKAGGLPVTSVAPSGSAPSDVPAPQPSDSRFAFLLMGYGGTGHDGAYLTDSMMVAIVDPARKSVALLSIPRDSWVPLVFSERSTAYNKVNTAYSFAMDASLYPQRLARYKGEQGPGTFAMDTVARQLGIPVSYYFALDFAGFREAVDAVGGVDVDVPNAFKARYPANDDPSIDPSWTEVKFDKGLQHMDGERAIRYSRAREATDNSNEGTDFARSRRQRLVMEAFKSKLFQPAGLMHMTALLGVASSHVDTNYSLPSILQLAQLAVGWWDLRIYQSALTNENYMVDSQGPEGTYTLVPDTADGSWSQVQAFARRLWQDPELAAAMANTVVTVENDAGVTGLAGKVGNTLAGQGYRVGTPTTGSVSARSGLVDMTDGDGKVLQRGLEADLRIRLEEAKAEKGAGPSRVILKLGSDYSGQAAAVPTRN